MREYKQEYKRVGVISFFSYEYTDKEARRAK